MLFEKISMLFKKISMLFEKIFMLFEKISNRFEKISNRFHETCPRLCFFFSRMKKNYAEIFQNKNYKKTASPAYSK